MTVNELIDKLQSLPEDFKDREIRTYQEWYQEIRPIDVDFELQEKTDRWGYRVTWLMMTGNF